MAPTPTLPSLLLLLLAATAAGASPTDFIVTSCKSTLYPNLCVQCLASYAPTIRNSPRALASAALTVALARTRDASAHVARLPAASSRAVSSRQAGAIRDCIETMRDGVDRIRRSVSEMGNMGRPGTAAFSLHLSNVQTWVSAALTDENTCLDGLSVHGVDPATRAALRKEIVAVAQVTSNALAFVNNMYRKH